MELKIGLSLTSSVYRRSAPEAQKPHLCVTTTLLTPNTATFELIGEYDSGNVLEDRFRADHFEFVDLTTGRPVINKDPFPGTCDPHWSLYLRSVVELHASKPLTTRRLLEDMSPLSDPVRQLEVGHKYRLKLKTQRIRCYGRSIADLFGGEDPVSREELLPMAIEAVLACDDELILEVEA